MRFEDAMKDLRRGFKITNPWLGDVYLEPRFTKFGRKKKVEFRKMKDSEDLIDQHLDIALMSRDDWKVLR